MTISKRIEAATRTTKINTRDTRIFRFGRSALGRQILMGHAYNQLLNKLIDPAELTKLRAFLTGSRVNNDKPFILSNFKRLRGRRISRVNALNNLVKNLGLSIKVSLELICLDNEYKIAADQDVAHLTADGGNLETIDKIGIKHYSSAAINGGYRGPAMECSLPASPPPQIKSIVPAEINQEIVPAKMVDDRLAECNNPGITELRDFVRINALLEETDPEELALGYVRGRELIAEYSKKPEQMAKILHWGGGVGTIGSLILTAMVMTGGITLLGVIPLAFFIPASIAFMQGWKREGEINTLRREFRKVFAQILYEYDDKTIAKAIMQVPRAERGAVIHALEKVDSDRCEGIMNEIDEMFNP